MNDDKKIIKNLLIVDDVKILATGFATYLELTNAIVNVDIATDGNDAIDLAKKNNYDVIMMDIRMSPLDGYQCSKILRNSDYKGFILGTTGDVSTTTKKLIKDSGINDVIYKPFTFGELLKKFNNHGYYFDYK